MKIDRIEPVSLRFAYPAGQGFWCAGGYCDARVTTLVEVHTDTGLCGLGSAYTLPALAHVVVKEQLEPLLRGREADDIESLWNLMYRATRWYGRKGAAMSALGAVDTALWDLRGKRLGKPVWELLGGRRSTCPAYASALLWQPVESLAAEARRHLDRGYVRMKMRLGRDEPYDTAAVAAVRQAIGSKHDLMCDASMRYHPALAERIGKYLATQDVFWLEEPFEPEMLDAYSALRGRIGVPLAAGENEFGLQGFRELIEAKAVEIVQPDVSRAGGISEVWRIAQLAGRAGLRLATHSWSDGLAVIANAHVVAASDCGLTVEVDQTGNPLVDDLLDPPLTVRDGQLELGREPGLGVRLNRTLVDRLRMADPMRLPEGFYSDMVAGAAYLRPADPYRETDAVRA
jgi:L-alanine-DL-glutamate epimerase-like enolase superfamily enzyme